MTELIISYLLQNEYAIRWKLLSYLKSRGYPITERIKKDPNRFRKPRVF